MFDFYSIFKSYIYSLFPKKYELTIEVQGEIASVTEYFGDYVQAKSKVDERIYHVTETVDLNHFAMIDAGTMSDGRTNLVKYVYLDGVLKRYNSILDSETGSRIKPWSGGKLSRRCVKF